MKYVIIGIGGFVVFIAFSWFMLDVGGAFSAKREAIRTQVHAESQSYVDGMKRELGRVALEWQKADTAGRIGIESHVRDVYSGVDTTTYPTHLQDFLSQIGVY